MARGKGKARIPQRSKLEADRETRRNISDNTFSPHRPLAPESSEKLRDVLEELKQDGHIPEHVKIRNFFRLTLFEKVRMRRSLERGIVGGYTLHGAIDEIKERTIDSNEDPLVVTIGKACLMNRRDQAIVVRIEDHPTLFGEHEAILETLGSMGLRGLEEGRPFKPHLQLAEAKHPLSITEKHHVSHVLEDVLGGQGVTLLPFRPGVPR